MSIHTVKINRMILKSDKNVVRRNASTLEKVCYNDNLLERIFKFLPISDLLSTRLVCTTWRFESNRILKSLQAIIILRTEEDVERISDLMDKQRVIGKTKLFNKFLMVFDRIHLEQTSVRNFLNRNGSFFEELSLKFWLDPLGTFAQNTPESFKFLLEKQVPNLKSLQFFGLNKKLWLSGEIFNESRNLLPKLEHISCLHTFDFEFSEVDYFAHLRGGCPLYVGLLSRLQSVRKITINDSLYWTILFRHATSDQIYPLRKFFSEVEEIRTEYDDDLKLLKAIRSTASVGNPISDSNILDLMPEVCPKVRILHLDYEDRCIAKTVVCNLLTKYSDQLEELWLNRRIRYRCGGARHTGSIQRRIFLEKKESTSPAINDFFSTSIFPKLRVIRTGLDIFSPASTVTQLIHQQLPVLEYLSLRRELPLLTWNYEFQHIRLHTLKFKSCILKSDHLLPLGQVFPNITRLFVQVQSDDDMQAVVRAFPELEELNLCSRIHKFSTKGVKYIGDLKHLNHLRIEGYMESKAMELLKEFKSITFMNINIRY